MTASTYTVSLYISHPDNRNDDCMTGEHFATVEEARACVANLGGTFDMAYFSYCGYVELDGDDVNEVTEIPGAARRKAKQDALDAASERSERRLQAGMMGGVDAYNDCD
jgi:hypothetical protein